MTIAIHQTCMRCVREFMDAFQQPYLHIGYCGPDFPTKEVACSRMAMLLEEVRELEAAETSGTEADELDAVVDILYVMYGGALEHGYSHESGIVAEHFAETRFDGWPDRICYFSDVIRFIGSILRPRIELFGQELFYKAFLEVHRSNMSKVWSCKPLVQSSEVAIVRTKDGWIMKRNGKVVKPPTYSKANLAKILEESGYRYRKKILASF